VTAQIPGITVIVPTYKRVADLDRCLKAIDLQSLPPAEVLITYRPEDEETCAYLARAERPAPNARLLVCETPGVVYALNRAFDAVRTEFLAITDDDAEPRSDWLERIMANFAADPQAAGVGGKDHIFCDGAWLEGEERVVGIVLWSGRIVGNHHIGVGPPRYVHALKGVNMSFRTGALGDLRLDRRLRGEGAQVGWELHLCFALMARGHKLIYDPAVIVEHFPGERPSQENRANFNPVSHSNAFFNGVLALMEYLGKQPWGWARQAAFLAFVGLRGTRRAPGLLLLIVGLVTGYPQTWARFKSTASAGWDALKVARP
jgi:hypothetical protein